MERTASPKPVKGTARLEKARGKRQQATADRRVFKAVDKRDGYYCRVCQVFAGSNVHRHHVKFRSAGGLTTTANVCHLCEECHRAVHAHRVKLSGNADGALKVQAATICVDGVGTQWAIYTT